jgi:hypothetical protein
VPEHREERVLRMPKQRQWKEGQLDTIETERACFNAAIDCLVRN